MNKKLIIGIVLFSLISGGIWYYFSQKNKNNSLSEDTSELPFRYIKDKLYDIKSQVVNKIMSDSNVKDQRKLYDDILVWALVPHSLGMFPQNIIDLIHKAETGIDLHNLNVIIKDWWMKNVFVPKKYTDADLNNLYSHFKSKSGEQ
jgi:hypothetical protein